MASDSFLREILARLEKGRVVDVLVGLHWTAVVTEVAGERRCGLASTVRPNHHEEPDVPIAGHLEILPARELAALALSKEPIMAGVGLAAINALLPPISEQWVTLNAADVIAARGAGKKVALIGHFPFVPDLYHCAGELAVLEQQPRPGDLPASAAPGVLAEADVVALTSMTIHNHTLPDLLRLCSPQRLLILLGPSTPLTPVLFDYGVDILCGSQVTDIERVLHVIAQGGNFRQVHQAGVNTVTMVRPDLDPA